MTDKPDVLTTHAQGRAITVRAASADDAALANAVQWSAGWKPAPRRHRHWPEADGDWQARRYYRELVAEVEGTVAARVGLEAYRQPFAELCNLCVRPDFQRMGLGKLLTQACQTQAAERGFTGLFLQTEIDNTVAHRLYTGLDFVPAARGKMLRMVKFIDHPLLAGFRQRYPLAQYSCTQSGAEPLCLLRWDAYTVPSYVQIELEGGSCLSDSRGRGPATPAFEWMDSRSKRGLAVRMTVERTMDLEPGHHVGVTIEARNIGEAHESGQFVFVLPPGIDVTGPGTNTDQVFAWDLKPGETVQQPAVLGIDPNFDSGALWYLNYDSVPICLETFWKDHRAMVSGTMHMAAPPPA